jgi:hypothetical protein
MLLGNVSPTAVLGGMGKLHLAQEETLLSLSAMHAQLIVLSVLVGMLMSAQNARMVSIFSVQVPLSEQ